MTDTTITPDILSRAARESLALAEQSLVRADGSIKVPEERLPTALRVVRTAMNSGDPTVVSLFENAVAKEIDSHAISVSKQGAAPGRTARLDVRNVEFGEVNGTKIRIERSTEGVRYYEIRKNGTEQMLAYNPFVERDSLGKSIVRALLSPKENTRIRADFKRFKARVNDIMSQVTDQDLMWSFSRLERMRLLEGILRHDGSPLVNKWPKGFDVAAVKPTDFDASTISREDLALLFKLSMDIELPAVPYSFASSGPLHDYFHDISHFMGSTLSERVTSSALHGESGKRHETAVWSQEEERHGPVLDAIYNAMKSPGEPVLHAQFSYPIVRPNTAKGARQMMLRREFAEIVAATNYLVLKANAKADSAADRALDGIFRDEVYHAILMQAGVKAAYNPSRLGNVVQILYNAYRSPSEKATDEVKYRRPMPLAVLEPLVVLEAAYAFMAIEKRIFKFMSRFSIEQLREAVGPVYSSEKQLEEAVARGEHTRTLPFRTEQNPDLSEADVAELSKRFPEEFDVSKRTIRESEVVAIIDKYRRDLLGNPRYWLERKDFKEVAAEGGKRVLQRAYEDGSTLTLTFGKLYEQPHVKLETDALVTYETAMADMTVREIGALMSTHDAASFAAEIDKVDNIERKDKRAWIASVVKMLSARKEYQAAPLTVIRDLMPIAG